MAHSRRIRYSLLAATLLAALAPAHGQDRIIVYPAYSDGGTCLIEGRVIADRQLSTPEANDRRRDNLRRSAGALFNTERKQHPVSVRLADQARDTRTDDEGYFSVSLEQLGLTPGWHAVSVTDGVVNGEGELLVVPAGNRHGVISDVDDTIQVTEVNDKSRMLANTLLKNALQRDVVPGVAAFYTELAARNVEPTVAPVFYLSASPRQLHAGIHQFIRHNGLPRGVLITKRITNDATTEPLIDQFSYKTTKLIDILQRLPQVSFTLIGDDGERDPEIFAEIRRRYPDRIAAVWIRAVNPDPKRAKLPGQGSLSEELSRYR